MGEGGSDPPSLPATLVDSLPSVSTVRLLEDLPRCNNDLASADFERLWLQVDAWLAMMLRNWGLNGELMHWEGRWCRATHPSAPCSGMLKDQRLTSNVSCSGAAEVKGACSMALELHTRGSLAFPFAGCGFGRDEIQRRLWRLLDSLSPLAVVHDMRSSLLYFICAL